MTSSKRRLLPATLLSFLLLAAGTVAVWTLLKPAPPKHIVMSTGTEGGAYARYGELYAAELAKDGSRSNCEARTGRSRTCSG